MNGKVREGGCNLENIETGFEIDIGPFSVIILTDIYSRLLSFPLHLVHNITETRVTCKKALRHHDIDFRRRFITIDR